MNTPAHAVIALATLGRGPLGGQRRGYGWAIVLASVLPDLPIFAFFLWQQFVVGSASNEIWGDLYFRPEWQDLFDAFNSIPLAAVGLTLGALLSRPRIAVFCSALLLHYALDLPLHHDDAHRHFMPFSDWRFASPVSYWDPRHGGALGAALETLALVCSSAVLWFRGAGSAARVALILLCALYVAGYAAFYVPRLLQAG